MGKVDDGRRPVQLRQDTKDALERVRKELGKKMFGTSLDKLEKRGVTVFTLSDAVDALIETYDRRHHRPAPAKGVEP